MQVSYNGFTGDLVKGEMIELYFKLKIIFSFAAIAVIAAGVIVAIVRNKR